MTEVWNLCSSRVYTFTKDLLQDQCTKNKLEYLGINFCVGCILKYVEYIDLNKNIILRQLISVFFTS